MLKSRNSAFFKCRHKVIRPIIDSPAPGKRVKHFKDWEIKHIPAALSTSQKNVEERANAANAPATSASLAPHTLAMSCHGYDRPKPKMCRKQLNGHLSSQTTIANRLESTFPPHLCKKIKFVPDSRQPFENGRILNLAAGLEGIIGIMVDSHGDVSNYGNVTVSSYVPVKF